MRMVFKKIWDEFVYGGHLVAFGSFSIALCYSIIDANEISIKLLIGVYLITYIIHLLDRYNDIATDSSFERKKHFEKYQGKLTGILLICFLALIAVFWSKGLAVVFISIIMLLAGILYGVFIKKITCYITGFKSYYTALAFSSIVLFSSYYYHSKIDAVAICMFLFFTLRWFGNTIFCDLKDVRQDSLESLKTFAVRYGKKVLVIIIVLSNILSIGVLLYGYYNLILPKNALLLSFSLIYVLFYIIKSYRKNVNYQYLANVWADGESFFWLILIVIGRAIWV